MRWLLEDQQPLFTKAHALKKSIFQAKRKNTIIINNQYCTSILVYKGKKGSSIADFKTLIYHKNVSILNLIFERTWVSWEKHKQQLMKRYIHFFSSKQEIF